MENWFWPDIMFVLKLQNPEIGEQIDHAKENCT